MLDVTIEDTGAVREVHIVGPHHTPAGLAHDSRFETFYSEELLHKIVEVMQEFCKDDIDRAENPAYLEAPLVEQLDHYDIDFTGKTVLDFGCGSGASAVIAIKLGAERVVGIDLDEDRVDIARLRVRDYGFSDRIEIHRATDTTRLPFDSATFDVVLAQGVIEHIHYRERSAHLREMWRLLAPGGNLLILETPNRLWPKDAHTTDLWLVPYMPVKLACAYARRFSSLIDSDDTDDDLLYKGIRGSTYWEIVSPLRSEGALELDPQRPRRVDEIFPLSTAGAQALPVKLAKRAARQVFQAVDTAILGPLHVPLGAFAPFLNLCLQKAA